MRTLYINNFVLRSFIQCCSQLCRASLIYMEPSSFAWSSSHQRGTSLAGTALPLLMRRPSHLRRAYLRLTSPTCAELASLVQYSSCFCNMPLICAAHLLSSRRSFARNSPHLCLLAGSSAHLCRASLTLVHRHQIASF